jgi:hypothetical protein
MGLIWGVQGGMGSPKRGVPRWHKLSGGERWWWHGGFSDGGLGEGPERWSTVAQRWQAQQRSCSEAVEEEERGCSMGRGVRSFYSR